MATLKNLVDETTNIKDELKTCHANLSSALTKKGVSVSSSDKMLNLINKIDDIEGYLLSQTQTDKVCILDTFKPSSSNAISSVGTFSNYCSFTSKFNGYCNVVVNCRNTSSNTNYQGSIRILVNGVDKGTFKIVGTSFYDAIYQIYLSENDVVTISYSTVASGYGIYLGDASIKAYLKNL